MTQKDIAPEASAVPVFLDSTPLEPPTGTPDEQIAAELAERGAAAAELVALGLTETRARVIAGLPPLQSTTA